MRVALLHTCEALEPPVDPVIDQLTSVLGAPAAILISLIMVPETEKRRTGGALEDPDMHASGPMDAIVKGTVAGLELLLNICAMLIVCRPRIPEICERTPGWSSAINRK